MLSNETSTLRIAGALGVPMMMSAAAVALAAYLGLSGISRDPPPASRGSVVVLEDLQMASTSAPVTSDRG